MIHRANETLNVGRHVRVFLYIRCGRWLGFSGAFTYSREMLGAQRVF